MAKYDIGRYEVEITGQGFQKASTGTLQLVLQFKVVGKIDPSDPNSLVAVMPGERKFYKAITANTVDWVMDDLKAIGVEGFTSWAQLDPTIAPEGFIDLTGKHIDMMCGTRNGQDGKSYEDWSIAREGGPGKPIEAADKKDVAALDRLFGKHLKKGPTPVAGGRRQPAAPAPQPVAAGGITDHDVPF